MLFDKQTINYYQRYFNLPEVVKTSKDIQQAVKSGENLSGEEVIASLILAYLEYNQTKNKNS